jgi:oleate hydratase
MKKRKAHLVGGGIGSLAAAAFMIRDGAMPARNITIYEALPVLGGSLDGAGNAEDGYSLRGGRMLTTDNFECTWGLFKSVPSLIQPDKSVYDETIEFNKKMKTHSTARLVDRNRAIFDEGSMGFSMNDRMELLKLTEASEAELGSSRITDWLSPEFFTTTFWNLWQTTFAFQPWHSAVEFKRYLHRFMKEFSRIETLEGVKRTIYNQYDALVLPLESWLVAKGVNLLKDCTVTDFDLETANGKITVIGIKYSRAGQNISVTVDKDDLVIFQNGSMTDASSLGSMTSAPKHLTKQESGGWALWEKLADGRPEFGNPTAFNSSIPETYWASFTVTLKDTAFFDQMEIFTGNKAGTGGLVTFKDSSWLMSVVLDMRYIRSVLVTSLRNRCLNAQVRKSSRSFADTSILIGTPLLQRRTAFRAGCLTSPACSCPVGMVIAHYLYQKTPQTSRSSASLSKSRRMSCSRLNIRFGRRRWPSTNYSISIVRSRQFCIMTNLLK